MRHILACIVYASLFVNLQSAPAAEGAGGLPRLILVGDSTVKNGSGKGDGGLYGWGQVIGDHFDPAKIEVENRALGGRSSRTYQTEGLWEKSLARLRPGDYVLIQFGHNDGGEKFKGNRPRASIKGSGDESINGVVEMTGKPETVHSYGWYIRKYITDSQAKGAIPIVLSLVPRNRWEEGKVIRSDKDYAKWAGEAAQQAGAAFIDLNELVARKYEDVGQEKVGEEFFTQKDWTHTTLEGAKVNAACVVEGIRGLSNCCLNDYLIADDQTSVAQPMRFRFGSLDEAEDAVVVSAEEVYAEQRGYGYEPVANSKGGRSNKTPKGFRFSVAVPPGNYRVKLTTCDHTPLTVKAELRRLMLEDVSCSAEDGGCEFIVNVRDPGLRDGSKVGLKPREKESEAMAWDEKLTLEFLGTDPCLHTLEIVPAHVPTIYLAGDSTVCDQPREPWASWGQMLTRFFKPGIAVANHAESGETLAAFLGEKRFAKIFELVQPGDYLLIQFGHNDMKSPAPNALEVYRKTLAKVVEEAREKQVTPVLITSMERKSGPGARSLGEYPATVRGVAAELEVALIDLNEVSKELYAALGTDLDHAFQDGTHHTNYGSYLLAQCVVQGMIDNRLALSEWVVDDFQRFDPAEPEGYRDFTLQESLSHDLTTPLGN